MFPVPLDDVQQFFAVLAALYAIECAWWLRGASWRFFRAPFMAWSDKRADGPFVDAWRLSFSNPFPFTTAFAGESCPFVFDGEALLAPVIDETNGREQYRDYRFSSIASITSVDKSVLIDGTAATHFTSPSHAAIVASRLERMRTAKLEDRQRVADEIMAEMYDIHAAQRRLTDWLNASSVTRLLGSALAVATLLCGPLIWAFRAELPPHLPAMAMAIAVSMWFATAVSTLLIPGRLIAGGHSSGMHRAIAFLSPATAMRIYDTLGRDTLVGFAPLVVAMAATPGSHFSEVVTPHLRVAIHPSPVAPALVSDTAASGLTAEALRWFHERTAFHAMEAVRAIGLEPSAMLATVADSEGANSFCPRCARTFVQHHGRCDVCDLALQPLQ